MSGRPLHALLLPNGPDLLAAVADALAGGPAVLVLDPAAPVAATDRLLASLRPAALVSADGTRRLPRAVPVPDEVAAVVATSGSTGAPKAVELPGPALIASATATLARLGARPGERWLGCLPPSHVAGLQVLVRSVVAGSVPVLHDGFDPARFGRGRPGAAEFTALVPTMLHRLLQARVELGRFRAILLGGAAASGALVERARAAGARVVTTYGMTETCGGCVYDGVPLDGVSVRLRSDGRIVLTGPVLARGYRFGPEIGGAGPAAAGFLTADLGRFDARGRLQVLGRADDVIVTGGVNVVPTQVADVLERHPGVASAYVLGRPDEEWGQAVVAVIVAADRGRPPTAAELRAHVSAVAGRELAPRRIVFTDAIPLLAAGKPDRAAIAGLAALAG